jgi:hypothetical protein
MSLLSLPTGTLLRVLVTVGTSCTPATTVEFGRALRISRSPLPMPLPAPVITYVSPGMMILLACIDFQISIAVLIFFADVVEIDVYLKLPID